MPLKLYFQPSFSRSIKHLDSTQKEIVKKILRTLNAYYTNDCNLDSIKAVAPRFFYKQLRKPYFEAGIERNLRVVICKQGSKCIAVLAGNHDQIKTFLAKV
jgi:hypothetical protein